MEQHNIKQNQKLIYALQLAEKLFLNSNPDVYRRIRELINNFNYDFVSPKGYYKLSLKEELNRDEQIYLTRKIDKNFDAKMKVFVLVGLGLYCFGEIVSYYSN